MPRIPPLPQTFDWRSPRFLAVAGITAALYAGLTVALAPISFGVWQLRVSEALTILPLFTPAAIPGLFVGCLIANLYTGNLFDIVFGSLATLLAALLTWRWRRKTLLAMLPPVVVNAVVIGALLSYVYKLPDPLWLNMLYIALGQTVAVYGVGAALYGGMRRMWKK